MSVIVVGLNHKTAPIELLERLAIGEDDLPKALYQLDNYEHILEAAVLSTCNRIEIYAGTTKFHGGVGDLRNFLAEFCHVAPEDFSDHLYTYHDEAAVAHLFRVAAGIDSMVIGESEILGQVRRAHEFASVNGSIRRLLSRAFTQAVRVGRRARDETAIGRNPVSVSSAAVDLTKRALDTLADKKVVLVGAGKMGRLATRALTDAGATDVTVVNRSEERAASLADAFGVKPLPLDELPKLLVDADIVISSTTAPGVVITKDIVDQAMQDRSNPLFIVDIAVPRDVDPQVGSHAGVVLRDIDDLRGVVDANLGSRLDEVAKVEALVTSELQRFLEWEAASEIAPTIATLVARAEAIRSTEVEHVAMRLSALSEDERAAVEQATKRMIAKLLHDPLTKAKELASSKQGNLYLAALRELFELDDEPDA